MTSFEHCDSIKCSVGNRLLSEPRDATAVASMSAQYVFTRERAIRAPSMHADRFIALNAAPPQGIAATSQNRSSARAFPATDERPHPSWQVRTVYSAQPTQPADRSTEVDTPDYGIETSKALTFRDPSGFGSARLRPPHSLPSPNKDPPHRTIGPAEHTS